MTPLVLKLTLDKIPFLNEYYSVPENGFFTRSTAFQGGVEEHDSG
jgi:hypothetical protein